MVWYHSVLFSASDTVTPVRWDPPSQGWVGLAKIPKPRHPILFSSTLDHFSTRRWSAHALTQTQSHPTPPSLKDLCTPGLDGSYPKWAILSLSKHPTPMPW